MFVNTISLSTPIPTNLLPCVRVYQGAVDDGNVLVTATETDQNQNTTIKHSFLLIVVLPEIGGFDDKFDDCQW